MGIILFGAAVLTLGFASENLLLIIMGIILIDVGINSVP